MQYRTNIKNNDKLSLLGFGCMRFITKGRKVEEPLAIALIRKAVEEGVNYFDTAYVYHNGQSEVILGKALSDGLRDKVKIATKLPHYLVRKTDDLDKIFKTQLEKLQTDHIDYYLIHMLGDFNVWQRLRGLGIEKWIADKKASGAIINIGFSFHGQYSQFIKLLDSYSWDFTQIQYNYMDTGIQAGTAGLKYAADKGLPIIIMEPLRGGKLTDALPREASSLLQQWSLTPAELALSWLFDQPEVTVVLSGMNSEAQLLENIAVSDKYPALSLSDKQKAQVQQIKDLINKDIKVPCTACRYCMPCPSGVDITACFNSYNEKYALKSRSPLITYIQNVGAFSSNAGNAGKCTDCKTCLPRCPQSIDIPKELAMIKKEMEGPLFKAVVFGARLFMGTKEKKETE